MSTPIGALTGLLEAVDRITPVLNKVADTADKTMGRSSSATGNFLGILGGFVGGAAIVSGVSAAFGFLSEAAIGMNATLETTELQFGTLMGNADKAREHVASLFEFAKKTPFETGPIIKASRMMETFGGAALNTKDNLTLLGDASAATGAPIDQLGFWVGRMYSNLQGGQPFGEAAMRLQELAVMSPQARKEMEALQDSGASGAEVFKVFQDSISKFGGAMEKQAGTWQGVVSTFTDTVQIIGAQAFRPLFEMLRDAGLALNEFMSTEAFSQGVAVFQGLIVNGIGGAVSTAGTLFMDLVSFASSAGDAFDRVSSQFSSALTLLESDALDNASIAFDDIARTTEMFGDAVRSTIQPLGEGLTAIGSAAWSAFHGIIVDIAGVWGALQSVLQPAVQILIEALGPLASGVWDAFAASLQAIFSVAELVVNVISGLVRGVVWLSDKLGITDAILGGFEIAVNATATALGWVADVFGIVAKAVGWAADKLNGFFDVAENLGIVERALPPVKSGFDSLLGSAGSLNHEFQAGTNYVASFAASTETASVNTKELAKAQKEAAKEANAFKKVQDQLFGRDTIEKAEELVRAVGEVGNVSKLTKESKEQLNETLEKALKAYTALGEKAPATMRDIATATRAVLEPTKQFTEFVQYSTAQAMTPFAASVRSFGLDAGPQAIMTAHGLRQGFVELKEAADDSREGIRELGESGKDVGDALTASLQRIPDILKAAFTGGGGLSGALKAIGVQMASDLTEPIAKALKGLGVASKGVGMGLTAGIGAAINGGSWKQQLGQVGLAAAGVTATAAVATGATLAGTAALGAMTLGIGAAAVGVGLLIRKFTGIPKEVKEARKEVDSFQEAIWDTLTPAQMAAAGGEKWRATVIGVRDAYIMTGRTAAEAEAAVAQMWNTDNPEAARAAMVEINAVMTESQKIIESNTAELKDLQAQMKDLTAEADVDWKEMQSAAEKYGIDLASLGGKFHSSRLHDAAQQIWNDFRMLTKESGNVGAVLHGMRDEISDLVNESIQFGTTIPENFKPLIQNLFDTGQLLDENGEAFREMPKINFGDPVVARLDAVASAIITVGDRIAELVDQLANGIGTAARSAADAVARNMRETAIPALEETADAITNVIEMNSPTGLEGIAHYSGLAAVALARMATGSISKLEALGDVISGLSKDSLVTLGVSSKFDAPPDLAAGFIEKQQSVYMQAMAGSVSPLGEIGIDDPLSDARVVELLESIDTRLNRQAATIVHGMRAAAALDK
jgi:hypothetical protein